MTLTPEREQHIRRVAESFDGKVLTDLLAEVDALRAAGDKLADAVASYHDVRYALELHLWREARRG